MRSTAPVGHRQLSRELSRDDAERSQSALELGDLDVHAFRQHRFTLAFLERPLEDRYRSYRARRARELGATPWVTRLGMLVARVVADAVDGLARSAHSHWPDVLATFCFGVLVLALYTFAKRVAVRDGDGSRDGRAGYSPRRRVAVVGAAATWIFRDGTSRLAPPSFREDDARRADARPARRRHADARRADAPGVPAPGVLTPGVRTPGVPTPPKLSGAQKLSGARRYERWVAAALALAVLQAVQVVVAFAYFGDGWSRPHGAPRGTRNPTPRRPRRDAVETPRTTRPRARGAVAVPARTDVSARRPWPRRHRGPSR